MSKIVNIIPAKKKAKEIKFRVNSPKKQDINEYIQLLGFLPFIWYWNKSKSDSGFDIDLDYLQYFELSIEENLPTIKIRFRDILNLFKESYFPGDDNKISIFLNPKTTVLKPIHLDFKIIKFDVNTNPPTTTFEYPTIYCVGVLDLNELYIKEFKSYAKSTSADVMKKISEEVGLGYNSNLDNPLDRMSWINPGMRLIDFMSSVWKHSYVSDKTFVTGFIDWYYNINFVDVEKELSRDVSKDKGSANTGIEALISSPESELYSTLVLSNDFALADSNCYFDYYKIINQSSQISLRTGYSTKIRYYDTMSKDYLDFLVDPLLSTSDTKLKLRGQPGDNTFVEKNIKYSYGGKLDVDNAHKNYVYAKIQNERNLNEIEKVGLEIWIKTPNYNLHKFLKVRVQISNQQASFTQNHMNHRLSGEWLIVDIKIIYQDNRIRQVIRLFKRELELSQSEITRQNA